MHTTCTWIGPWGAVVDYGTENGTDDNSSASTASTRSVMCSRSRPSPRVTIEDHVLAEPLADVTV